MNALGIICGGGDLPLSVAESAQAAGRPIFLLGLRGSAGTEIERFLHDWVALGETAKTIKLLHDHSCGDIVLAGRVMRPKFSDIKLDAKSILLLPRMIGAARKGDDALLRAVTGLFEAEGFRVVGIAEAAPGLLAPEGVLGNVRPTAEHSADIALAAKVVRALGALDIGQAAAVCDGLVLAVEAAEGTDAMIARIGQLSENVRGVPGKPRGILLKALKPTQDGKTDLPVIGVETVKRAAAAGLAGIAVEAGKSLIINRRGVVEAADRAGLFVAGVVPGAQSD
jgi:UDP-2,3-diacylglucosamine hydrolase